MSINWLIIGLTVVTSYFAFRDFSIRQKSMLVPSLMRHGGQWHRFITHGFIHRDWTHLLVNMFVLWSFGSQMEQVFVVNFAPLGRIWYIVLYFGGMLAASVPVYFRRRNDPSYASLGASGAVSAVLFSYILMYPMNNLYLFAAIPINSALFGILYVAYSTWMDKKGGDNTAHDAHLFGAIFGFLFPIILRPELITGFVKQIADYFG